MDIVINADDLGLHPAVQRAVELLGARGMLTSASLLANGPFAEQGAGVTAVSVGAHLNILRGRPISPARELQTLVDADGRFVGDYRTLAWRAMRGRLSTEEIEREWRAQVERLLDLGVKPSHVDSEKHIHCWPRLMPIACRVARRYKIAWVRRTVERVSRSRWDIAGWRVRLLNRWARRHREHVGVRWPDVVWGIADQGRDLEPQRFARYLRQLPDHAVVEVVCHPGDPRPDDPPLSAEFGRMRVASQWRVEFESLRDGGWIECVEGRGAELRNYEQLAAVLSPGEERPRWECSAGVTDDSSQAG